MDLSNLPDLRVGIDFRAIQDHWVLAERQGRQGSLQERDCAVTYLRGGRILAVASIGRDLTSLKAERELEQIIVSTP